MNVINLAVESIRLLHDKTFVKFKNSKLKGSTSSLSTDAMEILTFTIVMVV